MGTTQLTPLDLTIIGGHGLLLVVIAMLMARHTHSDEDLFFAGRRLS